MIEVSIYIPVADNDGHTFPADHHRRFDEFILDRFGGLTKAVSQVEGVWRDDAKVYEDRIIVYLVALGTILEGDKLREVLAYAKQHYRQEAIFLRYLGIAEIFR